MGQYRRTINTLLSYVAFAEHYEHHRPYNCCIIKYLISIHMVILLSIDRWLNRINHFFILE